MCYSTRVYEAETRRRRGKEVKSGVDGGCRAVGRASNEAKGAKSLPKTPWIGIATGGNAVAWAREAKNPGIRQAEAGHVRKNSRDLMRDMRKQESEAAGGGSGFAD
jgi:hypothetical protein